MLHEVYIYIYDSETKWYSALENFIKEIVKMKKSLCNTDSMNNSAPAVPLISEGVGSDECVDIVMDELGCGPPRRPCANSATGLNWKRCGISGTKGYPTSVCGTWMSGEAQRWQPATMWRMCKGDWAHAWCSTTPFADSMVQP